MKNIHRINGNIYITNDEEIKEGDYYIDFTSNGIKIEHFKTKDDWVLVGICGSKKIILTTDQDLIADGVQAIDDEFLEWFVKNPSCEFVEVERKTIIEYEPIGHAGGVYKYKTIIPKEEPKQEISVRLQNSLKQFNLTSEEATNLDAIKLKKIGFGNRSIIELQSLKPKEETLEEVAENKYPLTNVFHLQLNTAIRTGFIEGAKWQQQQNKNLYSDEDMTKYALYILNNTVITPKEWFNKNKKK